MCFLLFHTSHAISLPSPIPLIKKRNHNEKQGVLLPESKVMTWFVQTALGLHYMHSHKILHRDIKTQNVFILSSGRVVLGDLGISKVKERRKIELKKSQKKQVVHPKRRRHHKKLFK